VTAEIIIGALGVIVSVLLYFAGVKRGERQERLRQDHERQLEGNRQAHERQLERDRQAHERQLEQERQDIGMASRIADEYVDMVRRRYDSGVTAMARLGLDSLGSDALIRSAIEEMGARTGRDPWGAKAGQVEDIDLVTFFRHVREGRINFFNTPFENVVEQVRRAGGVRGAA
jgi:hypothetical protein